jgi:hypothetical protein
MARLRAGNPARAVARYVEVKAMLGGVTTLQGMRSSFASVSSAMRGLVRNVETRSEDNMPRAGSAVIDLDIKREEVVERFRRATSNAAAAFFYHLSEGTNASSRRFWTDLVENELLGPGLAGIHCLGIPEEGFAKLCALDAAIVWSPTSNLMLYGKTLPLQVVLNSGVTWALGCDWSVSGGKNPLFELKVAREEAAQQNVSLSSQKLVAAVTCNAARAVRWDRAVGSLREGFRADLIVMSGTDGDVYDKLIDSTEADLVLSMIDGVARVGTKTLFDALKVPSARRETVEIKKGRDQLLWLREEQTPLHGFTLERARKLLEQRMTAKTVEDEESAGGEFDSFQLILEDEMMPIFDEGEEAAVDPLLQNPDALTVHEDKALWTALEGIEHFKLDVNRLRSKYL